MADRVFRLDLASGQLSERKRTPQGGLIAKANLTRTGVFTYRQADGSTRRELRHPDEVFHPDSLATYAGAPLTIDHPGRVTPDNWKEHTVGHVGHAVRPEGHFVAGEIHLQDAGAIERAESGALREISCGYSCDLDPVPGEYQGEPYDAAQRNIRLNHVAMGPPGWGRMGPETRLRLDSGEAVSGEDEAAPYLHDDSSGNDPARTNMADKDLEKAHADLKSAQDALDKARQDAKDAKTDGEKLAAQTRADAAEIAKLRAENDALKIQLEEGKRSAISDKQRADAKFQADLEDLIQARADAAMVFATAEDPTGSKYDARGKTAEQIRFEIVANLAPKVRLDGIKAIADVEVRKGALQPVYDQVIGHKRDTDKAREDALKAAAGPRQDGSGDGGCGDDDDVPDLAKARKDMVSRMKNDWKKNASKKA